VVGIFLVLLNMVVDAVSMNSILSSPVWAPALISAGGISPAILGAAIGLAGLAMLSKLPELVPQYIFMIKPSPFGAAIGEGLKGIPGSVGKAGDALHRYTGFLDDKERIMPKKQTEPTVTRPRFASAGPSGYSQQKMESKQPITKAPSNSDL